MSIRSLIRLRLIWLAIKKVIKYFVSTLWYVLNGMLKFINFITWVEQLDSYNKILLFCFRVFIGITNALQQENYKYSKIY